MMQFCHNSDTAYNNAVRTIYMSTAVASSTTAINDVKEIKLKEIRIHSHYLHECLSALLHTILYLRAPNHDYNTTDHLCEKLFPFTFTKCGPEELDSTIFTTVDIFQKSLYKSGDNLRGEMVLSFYDRKEVKEYFGFVVRHEQVYFERWNIVIVLIDQQNGSIADYYQSAYDQLESAILSIMESVNNSCDHLPLAMYDFEMTILDPPNNDQAGKNSLVSPSRAFHFAGED